MAKVIPSNNQHTINDLAEYFTRTDKETSLILPRERRRYVVYLRKSTDDATKQVRSVEDQKAECLQLAKAQGITINPKDIFEDNKSAKTSNNRKAFTKIIDGFMTGKWHGLISWSPDRLSRNMKEAGEIIELIDHDYIQDLLFCTYSFENTPNGKMMLGILFATSKHYSDKLGVDVRRGITGAVLEGKYQGSGKKGYYSDSNTGYFIAEPHEWMVLRKAIDMRLSGETLENVADYLSGSTFGYRAKEEDIPKEVVFSKKTFSNLLSDPFYLGLYKYGNRYVNLTEQYNFKPLITPEEYILLNQKVAKNFDKEYQGRKSKADRLAYDLLRQKVICDFCDTTMQFQRTKLKKGKNTGKCVISYYCRNKQCIRRDDTKAKERFGKKLKKSIRAKYVTAHIKYTLQHCTKKSQEAYQIYRERIEKDIAIETAILKRKHKNASKSLKKLNQELLRYQDFQVRNPKEYKKHHKGKLESIKASTEREEQNLNQCKEELKLASAKIPSKEEFYELINSYLETILKSNNILEEDLIYKKLVTNLRAGDDCISDIQLNKPFDLLLDLSKVTNGQGGGT